MTPKPIRRLPGSRAPIALTPAGRRGPTPTTPPRPVRWVRLILLEQWEHEHNGSA